MSVFGVATTIAPIVVPDDAIGLATARYRRCWPGGVNSNVTDFPMCQSIGS